VPQPHQGQTNEVKQVKLTSAIQVVAWNQPMAAPGAEISLDVLTSYVGNGAEIEIELSEHSGKKHGKLEGMIVGNRYRAAVMVPEKARDALYADIKLSKHALKQKSPPLIIVPPIEITNLKWSAAEAQRGDILTVTADVEGAPDGTDAEVSIWEHDADGAHELVTKLKAPVEGGKIETEWEFQYQDDTADIPTHEETDSGYRCPEYFFRVAIEGVRTESGLLSFKDRIEFSLVNSDGTPAKNERYDLLLASGEKRSGSLDEEGGLVEKDVAPGPYNIVFPEIEDTIRIWET